jgi:DNA helicase-2/ATP-dependent DNA helicase PcrA
MTWLSEYPCRVPPNLSFIQATPSLGRIQYRSSSSSSFSTAIQSTTESDTSTADAGSSIILQDLNPSQVEAVTQPLSAITRVVAGPGSGKTRVLTCRIAYLLEEDPTNRILGVTFTRKAAGEMQKRLEKLLVEQQQQQLMESSSTDPHDRQTPDQDGEIVQETVGGDDGSAHPEGLSRAMLGTFHSICAKILRWNGDLLGSLPTVIEDMAGSRNVTFLDGNFAIVDQGEQLRILKESLKEVDVDLKDYDNLKPFAVLAAISDCKSKIAEGKNPFQANADSRKPLPKAVKVAHKVYPLYREKLLATNCIDFDDLIYMARELLFEHEEVRERLQRRWTHILVDEFQDTSRSQMDLIKLLTASSLFVVGDADQSIYSWRGAHVGSLSDFADEFQGYLGGVHTVYLMENYRSTSNIVNAAQKVISASSGKSSSGADKLRKNMKPKRGSGATPRIIACKDEKAEGKQGVCLV